MTVYRMQRAARSAWDSTGAMLASGRWNPIGTPLLYTAQHLSLAYLEALVHLDRGQWPDDYVWSKVELPHPPELLLVFDLHQVSTCQTAGAAWVQSGRQLAVQVPSIVIPVESNVLLNPTHPAYRTLVWSEPQPFRVCSWWTHNHFEAAGFQEMDRFCRRLPRTWYQHASNFQMAIMAEPMGKKAIGHTEAWQILLSGNPVLCPQFPDR